MSPASKLRTANVWYEAEVIRTHGANDRYFEVGFTDSKSNKNGVTKQTVNLDSRRGQIPANMHAGKKGYLMFMPTPSELSGGYWLFKPDPNPTPLDAPRTIPATRAGVPT